MTAVDLDALDKLRGAVVTRLHERHAPFASVRQCEDIADDLLAGPLAPLIAEARKYRALRQAVEGLIATAPVMRFDNDYPVQAVPISDLLSLRAVMALR